MFQNPPQPGTPDEFAVRQDFMKEHGLYAVLRWDDVRNLEGKLLTLLDASISDQQQRKALKDLARQMIWWNWAPSLEQQQTELSAGMPDEAPH